MFNAEILSLDQWIILITPYWLRWWRRLIPGSGGQGGGTVVGGTLNTPVTVSVGSGGAGRGARW